MSIHRRAIFTVLVFGFWLFSAHAVSAGPFADWLSEITERIGVVPVEAWRARPDDDVRAVSQAASALGRFATSREGALALAGVAVLLAAAGIAIRRRRGTGDLTLRLSFPDEVEASFEVSLSRRSGRRGRSARLRSSPPHTRHCVCRETQFDRVTPGSWFLRVEGTLRAPLSRATLLPVDEEIEIEIVAGTCTALEHSLPALESPVEFRIHWDRQPARDVGLGIVGNPQSIRYAGHGVVKMTLALGTHEIVIGAGDRVLEETVQVASYEPCLFQIDLATSKGLIFKGCPPAVPSYLQGDLGNAARALERDGQAEVASLLRARFHQEQGQTERAAEQLENAGRILEAAELRRAISDFDRAAKLFENAGEHRNAAEMYAAAHAWPEAARAYSGLEDWPEAARCFEATGDVEGLIGALEAQGEPFRAAALATENGDRARSIRLLQQIGPTEAEFGAAGELLALAYEREGHLDLAANQLERCLDALPPGDHAPQLEIHLSELLEESGEAARALEVLERLRDRDPTFPQVASRIEGLRKKLSGPMRDRQTPPYASPLGATAFVAQERYEILEEIGRGGMGLVYKARDRRLGRVIALKRMPETLQNHPTAVQLFLGEVQAAARMNHPNIVTLYDADQENGSFFITMELLEGLPLNAILEQRGRFGPRDSARLGIQVCAGLQFAHDQGIVHRDIKTSNLFITRDKTLKIMDFGLAKILEAVRNGTSTIIAGTPFYMAPEQATGQVADGRTDLYALGVTLFELSTGRLPFRDGNIAEQHRNAAPPDPASGLEGYPRSLADLIQRLMSKSPENRPTSANEVAQMLTDIVGGA